MSKVMEELRAERDALKAKIKTLDVRNNPDEVEKTLDELKKLDKRIDLQEQAEMVDVHSLSDDAVKSKDVGKFKTFAEQLRAIKIAATSEGRAIDPRLMKDEVSLDSMNTENGEDGGYAIQSDFLENILDSAFEQSEIVNRCRVHNVTANSNSANWIEFKDENDATKDGVVVAGGVYAAWTNEGGDIPISKPAFESREEKLGKITGAAIVTEEMLQDVPFMAGLLEDSFAEAVGGLLTEGVLNGKGKVSGSARQPLGVLNSNAVVAIPKTGTTLSAKDLTAMRSGLRTKNWRNAVWYMHSDLQQELPLLNDGEKNLIYMPSGGISGAQYETLFGKPIIYDDFLPGKGNYGEVLLADFNEYLLLKKGEARRDWSIHVRFLNDERVFRIVLRAGGAPLTNRVFSVRHSSSKRGAFVALGTKPVAGKA